MPTWQRVYISACAAVIGYALGYSLCVYGAWPKLTYFPYHHRWELLDNPPNPVPMNYLGLVTWGGASAALVAALVWFAAHWVRRPIPTTILRLAGAWALTAFALAGLFFTWNLLA
jgi:hypothetical protein